MSSRIKLVGILAALEAFLAVSVLADPFSPTTVLPEAHFGHTLASASGFLYNIGGLGGTSGVSTAQKVFYAPIQNLGSLGTWTEGTSLPEAVFFHSSVLWHSTVYVLGGFHFNNSGLAVSNVVYYSRLNADGSVGSWQTAAPLPQPAYFLSAAVWNGTIYVTGGSNGTSLSNGVYSADIQADGSLGPWKPQLALPQGVYTHVAVSQGTLYVLGGVVNNGTQVQNTVYYAKINSDKTLAGWNTTTPLPQPLSNHGAAVAAGQIWVTGGFTGSAPTNAAVSAAIASDGTLGAWSSFTTLASPLYLHAEAATDKFLYVSGGTDGQNPQNAVYFMPLPPPPQPQDILPPRTTLTVGAPRYGSAPPFIAYATPLSLSTIDDALTVGDGKGVGLQSTQYAVDSTTFAVYQSPFTIGTDGFHWVNFFSTDKVGNTEAVQSSSVAVDGTPPISSPAVGSPRALLASGSMVVGPQTQLSVTANDPVVNGVASGVSQVLSGIDGAPLAAASGNFKLPAPDGAHTIRMQASDNLQNTETLHQSTLYLDATPPVTSVSVAPSPYVGTNGIPILNASSLISFSAVDPVNGGIAAGVNHTEYALDGGNPVVVGGSIALSEGTHALSYRSIDNVGNAELARSANFAVDATPPLTALGFTGTGITLFNIDMITPETCLTLTAQDPVSNGVASGVSRTMYSVDGGPDLVYSLPFQLAAGKHTVSYGSIDNAGNVEGRHSASISVISFLADALAGVDSIVLSGRTSVTGVVRTNGAFVANGRATVYGDVYAVTAVLHGRSQVTGAIHQGQATLPPPSFDLDAARAWVQAHNDNASIPAGFLRNGTLSLDSRDNLTLAAGNYYLTGIALRGQASLAVSGRVNIFVHGPISITGGSRLNDLGDAANLWIVCDAKDHPVINRESDDDKEGRFDADRHDDDGHKDLSVENRHDHDGEDEDSDLDSDDHTNDVALKGHARAALHLYAPLASILVKGHGEVAGRILGRFVSLSGKAMEPSATVLPPPTHDPGSAKHLPRCDDKPGSGTVTAGHRGDRDEVVVSSRLDLDAPAPSPIRHDGTATPSQSSPVTPSGISASKGHLAWSHVMPSIDLSSHTAFSLVSSQGNTVRSHDHSGVVIPEGATSASLGVTVAPEKTSDDSERRRRDAAADQNNLKPAGSGVEFGPEGTHFAKPVTIEVPYDRSLLPPGTDETGLVVHYWNAGKGDWEALASVVDTQAQVVRAQTDHFSLYKAFSGAVGAAAPSVAGFGFGDVYAFPNPAHPGQNPTIHVEAGSADQIEIRIYDLSGELRHSVTLSGPQTAFEYAWDVGGAAGSGVYLYVVKASKQGVGSIRTKGKLAVIK